MSEELVYEGRLCTIRRVSKLLMIESPPTTPIYNIDELLSELQLIMAAVLGEKG